MVCDEDGRYIIANIETDKECYTLVNIYAPNDPKLRNSFFKHINEKLSERSIGSIIIGGDFAAVLYSQPLIGVIDVEIYRKRQRLEAA